MSDQGEFKEGDRVIVEMADAPQSHYPGSFVGVDSDFEDMVLVNLDAWYRGVIPSLISIHKGRVRREGVFDDLAPRDPAWHRLYLETMLDIGDRLEALVDHPAFEDGEDLRDWVEALKTLCTFFPRTHKDIEISVLRERREHHGEDQHPQEGSP